MEYPTNVVEIFDNPIDFVETINKRDFNKTAKRNKRFSSKESSEYKYKFTGTWTYEEANNLFYSGVDTNIKQLEKQVEDNIKS